MLKILIWLLLLAVCWPLAVAALFLFPLIWLILLPFRLVGVAFGSAFALVTALFLLPVRIIRSIV
jgi:hypothetical protein